MAVSHDAHDRRPEMRADGAICRSHHIAMQQHRPPRPEPSHVLQHHGSLRQPLSPSPNGDIHPKTSFWALTLGSIGVVYGDIGTSPLYALRESVVAAVGAGNPASEPVVLGILSLIIWALIVIVSLKYVFILLQADNDGEGGTLALMALAHRAVGQGRAASVVILLGIISGALFYGDAIITPALSVLSAVEG